MTLRLWAYLRKKERAFFLDRFWFWHGHEKPLWGYTSKWPTLEEYKISDKRRLLHRKEMNRLKESHMRFDKFCRRKERACIRRQLRLHRNK